MQTLMQTCQESEIEAKAQEGPGEQDVCALSPSNTDTDGSEAILSAKPELEVLGWNVRFKRLCRCLAA